MLTAISANLRDFGRSSANADCGFRIQMTTGERSRSSLIASGTRSVLAMEVSQARNLLTQYGASAEGPSGVDAHRLAEKLAWTLRANLSRGVGFTAPEVEQLFQRNGNFRHLCAQYPP